MHVWRAGCERLGVPIREGRVGGLSPRVGLRRKTKACRAVWGRGKDCVARVPGTAQAMVSEE